MKNLLNKLNLWKEFNKLEYLFEDYFYNQNKSFKENVENCIKYIEDGMFWTALKDKGNFYKDIYYLNRQELNSFYLGELKKLQELLFLLNTYGVNQPKQNKVDTSFYNTQVKFVHRIIEGPKNEGNNYH